jgi:Plasmid pRiA4b ORF-3-like protein
VSVSVAPVPAVLRFDAALEDFDGVRRSIEVREDQTLVDLHDGIQAAFGWLDDHLYSFWLDGHFFGSRSSEYTAPIEPDEGVATADVAIAELALQPGAELAYVFDFGDSWRVALRLAGTSVDDGARYPRVVATAGDAPPQYPELDEDQDDDDAWLREWEAAERGAAEVVIEALSRARRAELPAGALAAAAAQLRAGLSTDQYPYSWMGKAAGLDAPYPSDDAELLLDVLAATISPEEETGLDSEDEASIMALELGDWAGAVIELCRRGPGASAEPRSLVEAIEACEEIVGPPSDPSEAVVAETAFELVGFAWQAAGVLDDRRGLTAAGAWLLPRALTRAWGVDFESGEPRPR